MWKDIKIKHSTREKMKILATVKNFRSYDELINHLIEYYCRERGINIKISIKESCTS